MFWNKYPYTNVHELNLDWILAKMQELHKEWDEFTAVNKITNAGAWDITKQYQAWTIVSDNNIGYISLQPVPAGVAITNTEYWGVIADYDILITDLSNRISILEGQVATLGGYVSSLQANEFDHIVVCGDSWVAFDDRVDHPNRTQWLYDRMAVNSNIHNYAVGGSGASGLAAQLSSAQADTAFDNKTVKKVFIVSGVNDYVLGVPYGDYTADINATYDTYIQVFPNAEFTILFDCFSPNSIGGSKTYDGCMNYFRTVLNELKVPAYFLGYYMIQPTDFEASSGASYHLSASGGKILGKLFDCVINGNTPNFNRLVSKFAADTDLITSKAFNGSTPSDINMFAMGVLQNVTGNNLHMALEISTASNITCDTLAILQDLTAPAIYSKSAFIPYGVYKVVSAYAKDLNHHTYIMECEDSLFTGTYQGVSLTHAIMLHLNSAELIRTVLVDFINVGAPY